MAKSALRFRDTVAQYERLTADVAKAPPRRRRG